MIKFILLALAIYIAYKLFFNDFKKKQKVEEKENREEMEKKVASGEMVKDPVCGTYVLADESITVRDGKNVYHFCSYDCRDKFLDGLEAQGRSVPPNARQKD